MPQNKQIFNIWSESNWIGETQEIDREMCQMADRNGEQNSESK